MRRAQRARAKSHNGHSRHPFKPDYFPIEWEEQSGGGVECRIQTRRGRYWQSEKKKLNQSSNTWKRLLRKEKRGASVTAQARARGGKKTTLLLVDIEQVGSLLIQQ